MAETIACAVCGATSPRSASRCSACGARLDSLPPGDDAEERLSLPMTFRWVWVLASAAAFLAWVGLVLVLLPMVASSYDPQGLPGLILAAGGWMLIALVLAALVPGRSVFEPAVGAVASVLPTVLYLRTITDVRSFEIDEQIFGGLLGILLALLGGFLGDRLHRRRRRRPSAAPTRE